MGLHVQKQLRMGEVQIRHRLLESEPARTVARRHMRQRASTSTGHAVVLGDRGTARQAQREAGAGLRTDRASFSKLAEDRAERAQGAKGMAALGLRST